MGILEQFDIIFDNPLAVYEAGQTVRGHVAFSINKELKMRAITLDLVGRARVHWKDNKGKSGRVVYFRAEEDYFEEKILLYRTGGKEESLHPPGSYTYPFQLDLSGDLPSSFEGQFGYVRYMGMATVDLKFKVDYVTKSAFTVLNHLNLNEEGADLQLPVEGEDQSIVGQGWLNCWPSKTKDSSNSVKAKFRIEKRAYVPGESIVITGHVTESAGTQNSFAVQQTTVALKQATQNNLMLDRVVEFYGRPDTMFSSKELKPCTISETVAGIQRNGPTQDKVQRWNGVALKIPPLPPSKLEHCKIINISYDIEFHVKMKHGADIKFSTPITIGTIPLDDDSSMMPDEMSEAAETDKDDVNDDSGATLEIDSPSVKQSDCVQSESKSPLQRSGLCFEECVTGKVNIKEKGDSSATQGKLTWAPVYFTYRLIQQHQRVRKNAELGKELGTPWAPVTPSAAMTPSTPVTPSAPMTPTETVTPSTPMTPSAPVTPSATVTPSTPISSSAPMSPSILVPSPTPASMLEPDDSAER